MITYEYALLLGIVAVCIFLVTGLLLKNNKKKLILGCIFIAYLSVVVSITLFPITYLEQVEYYGDISWYNFIPFFTIFGAIGYGVSLTALAQVVGNIIMTVPYGVFIMFFLSKKRVVEITYICFDIYCIYRIFAINNRISNKQYV